MSVFLRELAFAYPHDIILLICDGAAWHKANALYYSLIEMANSWARDFFTSQGGGLRQPWWLPIDDNAARGKKTRSDVVISIRE